MKSEERHHLHENDLAQALEGWMQKVEPYSKQILIGVLAVAVLGVGIILWMRSTGSASEAAWTQFARAQAADDYLTVADDHAGTEVALWAKLRAGEEFLNQGLQVATTDKKSMEERLANAQQQFQDILQDTSAPDLVRERALFGMAVSRESLSSGETEKAVAAYDELVRTYPDSRYARLAKQRIESLKTESAKEFYAWFHKQPRNPEERPQPKDLPRGQFGGTADPFPAGHGAIPQMNLGPDDQAAPQRDTGRPPSPRSPERPAEDEPAPPFPEEESPPAAATPEAAPQEQTTPVEKQPDAPAESTEPAPAPESPVDAEKPAPESEGNQ
jgi:hypothetical protein